MKKTVSLALVVLMIAAMFSVFTLASSADDDYTLADGVLTVKADIECNTKEYPCIHSDGKSDRDHLRQGLHEIWR